MEFLRHGAYSDDPATYRDAFDTLLAIADTGDVGAAWTTLEAYLARLGFIDAGIACVSAGPGGLAISTDHGTTGYRRIADAYVASGLPDIDPSMAALAQGQPVPSAYEFLSNVPVGSRDAADQVGRFLRGFNVTCCAHVGLHFANGPGACWVGVGSFGNVAELEFPALLRRHWAFLRLAGTTLSTISQRQRGRLRGRLLSVREAQVLALVARGLTMKEIAEEQGKALSTIRQQLVSARQRLGAMNSAHAVSLAQAAGEIPAADEIGTDGWGTPDAVAPGVRRDAQNIVSRSST